MANAGMVILALAIAAITASGGAQVECDRHVYPGAWKIYGNNAQPGDRVCVHAGLYDADKLEFLNFVGESQNPITITNVGGQVVTYGTLYLTSSRHVVLNGSGDKDVRYGFKVVDPYHRKGLQIGQGRNVADSLGLEVSGIEAHHIEILYDTVQGHQAVSAWNDYGSGMLEGLVLHDMLIHRGSLGTYTEGFYVGSSYYDEENVSTLSGVEIYDNRIEESGQDGIQVGSASGGCEIFGNTIVRDSRERVPGQMSGIIINPGSRCDVHGNEIIDGYGPGIYFQGISGCIYDNLIAQIERELLAGLVERAGSIVIARGDVLVYGNVIMQVWPLFLPIVEREYD